jgi:hypothetical protein
LAARGSSASISLAACSSAADEILHRAAIALDRNRVNRHIESAAGFQ